MSLPLEAFLLGVISQCVGRQKLSSWMSIWQVSSDAKSSAISGKQFGSQMSQEHGAAAWWIKLLLEVVTQTEEQGSNTGPQWKVSG